MTRLQMMREKAGLSRQELAEAIGMPADTYRAYEQGKRLIDRAELRNGVKICRVLGCEPEDIMECYAEYFNQISDTNAE